MAEENHMELRTADDCIKDSYLQSYINKVLVLNPKSLNEAYRHGEFQYFLGQSGFGAEPGKLGTKVYGKFLIDGENACFHRGEILGIADENKLPDWVKQKYAELTTRNNENTMRMV